MAWIARPLLALALLLLVPADGRAVSFLGCDQAPEQAGEGPHRGWVICKPKLPIVDVRGRGAAYGQTVAISGSHDHVILKVHGERMDIIRRAEMAMRTLASVGYPALAIVLADGMDPTVMEVFSGGRTTSYEIIRKVDAHNGETLIQEVVVEAYGRDLGARAKRD